jgi:hypothetical protein
MEDGILLLDRKDSLSSETKRGKIPHTTNSACLYTTQFSSHSNKPPLSLNAWSNRTLAYLVRLIRFQEFEVEFDT